MLFQGRVAEWGAVAALTDTASFHEKSHNTISKMNRTGLLNHHAIALLMFYHGFCTPGGILIRSAVLLSVEVLLLISNFADCQPASLSLMQSHSVDTVAG